MSYYYYNQLLRTLDLADLKGTIPKDLLDTLREQVDAVAEEKYRLGYDDGYEDGYDDGFAGCRTLRPRT